MSLTISTAVPADNISAVLPGPAAMETLLPGGKSFSEILELARQVVDGSGIGLHAEIVAFEQRIQGGPALSAQDLILYQIKAGRFGLGVEMVSKLAEGMMSTVRRFQQGQ